MNFKKTICTILLITGMTAIAAPLNFECDLSPAPLKIDCPNDEFHSLGFYPPTDDPLYINNPEHYAIDYQWGSDYMSFAYGWYYTHGTARVGIIDTAVTLTSENSENLRTEFSGTFASVNDVDQLLNENVQLPVDNCKQVTINTVGENFNWERNNNFGSSFGTVNPTQHHISGHPAIFVNEFIRGNSTNAKIELAIKMGINLSNFSMTLDHPFDEDTVTFSDNSPITRDDLIPLTFNISDFHTNNTTAHGYRFYTIDRFSTSKTLTFGVSGPRPSQGTQHYMFGANVTYDMFGAPEFLYSVVKINNQQIMSLKSFGDVDSNNIHVSSCQRYFPYLYSTSNGSDHGSMVLSILGSMPDNSVGMSSFCRDCSLSYADSIFHNAYDDCSANGNNNCTFFDTNERYGNLNASLGYSINSGNQIINMSLGDENIGTRCSGQESLFGLKLDICNTIERAYERDVVITAAAGNSLLNSMQFPAMESEHLIGVAGIDSTGSLWVTSPGFGSNFSPLHTKFAAPAGNVVVNNPDGSYSPGQGCIDTNFGESTDGYQLCNGTSFSAPIMASLIAMIRSINPLISINDIKQILWDSRVQNLPDQRYAIPKANKSIKLVLGVSDGSRVVNRLTPMFRMKTSTSQVMPGQISYLSTTIPQVAVAAKFGSYLGKPENHTGKPGYTVPYRSDTYSPIVAGYTNFKYEQTLTETARAPFFVFGGHRNPFNNEAADLLPLHHLARPRFSGINGSCLELADHAYSTSKQNGFSFGNNFCSLYQINYLYEGIDGYILPSCPNGVNCYENTSNANDAQCLKVRYSTQDNGFALMMASEINEPMFASYGTSYKNRYGGMSPINTLSGMSNAECLGYVFPNVDSDSDGVVDGMELVLGTDPNSSDSDSDGILDGVEYPLAGIPRSDPLISEKEDNSN